MTTIVTHNSTYHADDVFAVATLLLIEPDAKIIRTRDVKEIDSADYVVDVGYIYDPSQKKFDHHQPGGAGKRSNGIEYASFGLVWKEYGEKLAGGKREAEIVDQRLVQPLDAQDNGIDIAEYKFENVRHYTVVDFLYSYLSKPYESEENLYNTFISVVEVAKSLIQREILKTAGVVESEQAVKKIYEESEDKNILVLDKEYHWGEVVSTLPGIMYVVYPRNDGNWGAKAARKTSTSNESRKPFPRAWGGKMDEDLQKITGVTDAIFAHRGLFMVAAKSKEGVIKLAQLALKA